jgi:hypothetical protein
MNEAKLEVLEELIEALGGADILGRLQKRMADKNKKHEAKESESEEKDEHAFEKDE